VNKLIIVISIIIFVSVFQSCEKPVRTELTKTEKEMVDSIYAEKVGKVRKLSDSICDEIYPILYKNAKDSFYQLYIEEIEAIWNSEG